eukprot:TRINITY_DN33878_c0_g1_i1.p1 TRINITY_DN33878_c0_g1~~TRINITY_DN33878_c0_g1_i1.p1  ORF type:complete len:221 (-),score=23.26 TRINITY_DN33878_c0_g1_i1:142-804(-)
MAMSTSSSSRVRSRDMAWHQRRSLPGYTGFVPGRYAEDVHGVTYCEANKAAHKAVCNRSKSYTPTLTAPKESSMDRGSMHCTVGCMDSGRFPEYKSTSLFHNPRGLEPRAGAAIPGYAGHIPGKYVGNVIGKRESMANIAATQERLGYTEGKEFNTNWITHAEGHRKQHTYGSGTNKERWTMTEPWTSSRRGITRLAASTQMEGGWKLYEPRATHELLRY